MLVKLGAMILALGLLGGCAMGHGGHRDMGGDGKAMCACCDGMGSSAERPEGGMAGGCKMCDDAAAEAAPEPAAGGDGHAEHH